MRNAEDPDFARALKFFRDPSASLTPVRASGLLERVRVLSQADVASDPLWDDAVIVTVTNAVRVAINKVNKRTH